MRNKANKHLGIEIDPALHHKLRYIANYEGRSINAQVLYLIRQCIRDFEQKDGPIPVALPTDGAGGLTPTNEDNEVRRKRYPAGRVRIDSPLLKQVTKKCAAIYGRLHIFCSFR